MQHLQYIYMMYNTLCEYKGAEGNYLLPYILILIYYDYYSTILNTVYCLLDTGGATCGTLSWLHSPEPSFAPENFCDIYDMYPTHHV